MTTQTKQALSLKDVQWIVQLTQELQAAHQRRHSGTPHPTPSEREMMRSLLDNLLSLERNRRGF